MIAESVPHTQIRPNPSIQKNNQVKIIGICSSCFSKTIFGQKPNLGLCIVCPNCGAILENLHVISSSQSWPFEDRNNDVENFYDLDLDKRISEEND